MAWRESVIALVEDSREIGVEACLLKLVALARDDEVEASRDDVLDAAKKRRRRLGMARMAVAGQLGELTDIWVETATVCDLADLHHLQLSDADIAAHLLVLWTVYGDVPAAQLAMAEGTVGATLKARFTDRLGTDQPLTPMQVVKILWRARQLRDDMEGTSAVGAVIRPGRQAKKFIKAAEAQLLAGR